MKWIQNLMKEFHSNHTPPTNQNMILLGKGLIVIGVMIQLLLYPYHFGWVMRLWFLFGPFVISPLETITKVSANFGHSVYTFARTIAPVVVPGAIAALGWFILSIHKFKSRWKNVLLWVFYWGAEAVMYGSLEVSLIFLLGQLSSIFYFIAYVFSLFSS